MEPKRQQYKGHRIEVRARRAHRARRPSRASEAQPDLLIDDEPVRYGQLPNGLYALHEYAYDWRDNLIDLAKRFIDYRDTADEFRRERGPGGEN